MGSNLNLEITACFLFQFVECNDKIGPIAHRQVKIAEAR